MWHDFLPAVVAAAVCSLIMGGVYYSLWFQKKEKYLLIWALSWLLYSFRFAFRIYSLEESSNPVFFMCAQTVSVLSSVLLVYGGFCFTERKLPKWLWALTILGIIWGWVGSIITSDLPVLLVPAYFVIGAAFMWTAAIFLQQRLLNSLNRYVLALALLFWGLHKIDYPFLITQDWFAPWGYVLGAVFAFVVGLGFLMCVLQQRDIELQRRQRQLSLTFNSTRSGTWEWDIENNRVDYCGCLSRLLDYEEQDIPDEIDFFHKLIHDDDEPHAWKGFEKILKGEAYFLDERLRLLDSAGKWHLFLIRANVTGISQDAAYSHVSVIMMDISLYDEVQQSRDYLQELYQTLFDNMYAGVALYRPLEFGDEFQLIDINVAGARLYGVEPQEIRGGLLRQAFPGMVDSNLLRVMKDVSVSGKTEILSVKMFGQSRMPRWVDNRIFRLDDGTIGVIFEDASEVHRQETWNQLSVSVLDLLNDPSDDTECIRNILELMRQYLAIDSVGLRLMSEGDFPYFESRGFTKEFLQKENSVFCENINGSGRNMECLCGLVLSDKADLDSPYFTSNGSFWINNAEDFAGKQSGEINGFKLRGYCLEKGYFSVALIPLRCGDQVIGLLQLNARDKEFFSSEMLQYLEKLAGSIAIAVRRMQDASSLRQSEERFREIYEHAPLGILLLDQDNYKIRSANCAFERITGLAQDKLIGRGFMELVVSDDSSRIESIFSECLMGKKISEAFEYRIKGEEASPLISSMVACQNGVNGNSQYLQLLCQDVTSERHLQEQLVQSSKMDAIAQLAAGIAHDFNNQLAGIMGFADIIVNRVTDGQIHNFAEAIVRAAQHSADLTQQLLAFSRRRGGVMEVVNLHNTVKDTLDILGKSVTEGISIRTELLADNPCIKGDPAQLQSALLHIAVNARDAMPDGGELVIKTEDSNIAYGEVSDLPAGEYIRVEISDTGPGIPEDNRNRIFEPFFTTKPQGKGTGMGLAAVFGIITSHAGIIRLEDMDHTGACFVIYLPCLRDEHSYAPYFSKLSTESSSEGALVLAVDDEPVLRSLLSSFLEDMGHQVILCANGEDALKVYRSAWQDIDLVLLDIIMPVMDGEETFKEMRKINPLAKVIITSGYSQEGQAQRLLDSGACGYIQKPFESRTFVDTVNSVLNDVTKS